MTEAYDLGIDGIVDAQPLSAGGNAIVYRARQPAMDREVVVKILRAANDPAVKRRFEREQKAMGRLSQHPGIVPVYQSGLTNKNDPYLVMPYYRRGSLEDELVNGGRFDAEQARQDLIIICDAIHAAHTNGVLHRDIKPGNILRSDEGRPIVADFGIARMMDHSASVSTALTLTPLYSPPEVFEGAEPAVGHDVYGLGAVLFALLNGKAAYDRGDSGASVLALMRRVTDHPLPPLPESTPPGVVAAVRQAMAKKPHERYSSVADFAAALRDAPNYVAPAVLPRRTITSRPRTPAGVNPGYTTVIRPLGEQSKKRSMLPVLVLAAIALIAVAAVLYALGIGRSDGNNSTAISAQAATEDPTAAPQPTATAEALTETPEANLAAIDLMPIADALAFATTRVEGVACGNGFSAAGVALGDNRVLVPARYGRTVWAADVTGAGLAAAAPVDDVLVWPEVAMLRTPSDLGTPVSAESIMAGATVYVMGATAITPTSATVAALNQAEGTVSLDAAVVLDASMPDNSQAAMIGAPVVDANAVPVGMVTAVAGPTELTVAFDPTLVVRDPVVVGGSPDYSCPAAGGDVFTPASAEGLRSTRISAFLTAQELANAFARNDWAQVRSLEPGKAFLTNTRFEEGWGLLDELTLFPLRSEELDPGVWDWRVGIVAYETHDAQRVTTVFCNTWRVDTRTAEVRQSEVVGEGITIVGPDEPDFGWVNVQSYIPRFADAQC